MPEPKVVEKPGGKLIHEFRIPFERSQRPQGTPYTYSPQYYFTPGATSEQDVVSKFLDERRRKRQEAEMERIKQADLTTERVEAETETMKKMKEQARELGYNVEFMPIAEGQTQQGPAQQITPEVDENPLISILKHMIDKADESEKAHLQSELRRLEDKIAPPSGSQGGGDSLNTLLKSIVDKMGEQDRETFLTRVENIVKGSGGGGGGQSELSDTLKSAFDSLSQANRQALLAEMKAMIPAPAASGGGGTPLDIVTLIDKILDMVDRRTPQGGGVNVSLGGGEGAIPLEQIETLMNLGHKREALEFKRETVRGLRESAPSIIDAVGNTIREIRAKSPSSSSPGAEAKEIDVPCPNCKTMHKVKPGQEVVTCECGAEIHVKWA